MQDTQSQVFRMLQPRELPACPPFSTGEGEPQRGEQLAQGRTAGWA